MSALLIVTSRSILRDHIMGLIPGIKPRVMGHMRLARVQVADGSIYRRDEPVIQRGENPPVAAADPGFRSECARALLDLESDGYSVSREQLEDVLWALDPSPEYLAAERRRAERAERAELNKIAREEAAERREIEAEEAEAEEARQARDAARRADEERENALAWERQVKQIQRKDR